MKRRTFYHISLSLPYVALAIAGAVSYFANGFALFNEAPSSSLNILLGTMIFFTVSAVVWGPLYTWMVVAMLIWGRGKRTEEVRLMYILSPILLACSMGIPALIVDPRTSAYFLLEGILRMNNMGFAVPVLLRNVAREMTLSIGVAWLFMAAISIVVGYAFVGIVLWVERAVIKRNMFKEENVLIDNPPPL